MNKKQKKFLFYGLILLFFSFANFTFALEAKYPVLPGLPFITDNSGLPELIQYFFGIGIAFGGVVALISLAIAGVQIIIGQANPEGVSNAKDRIRGSLLGLVLLMVSFLILKTINPVLIAPNITKLSNAPGIFYVDTDNNKETPAPSAEADTGSIPPGFSTIQYRCPTDSSGNPIGSTLLVWTYPEKNFGNSDGSATTYEVGCNAGLPIIVNGSFKMAFEIPGVYFYKSADCTGYRSDVVLTSGEMPKEFKNVLGGSVEFINEPANQTYYGIIFHESVDQNRGGNCQAPLISAAQKIGGCKPITIQAFSETLFSWNPNPLDSGNGVDFYSKPYGFDTKGADAGIYELAKEDIQPPYSMDPSFMDFDYYGSGVSAEEEAGYPDFESSPGSIRIKGKYLVALYSGLIKNAGEDNPTLDVGANYCQVFLQDVVDMNGTEYIGSGNNDLKLIYVIPTK